MDTSHARHLQIAQSASGAHTYCYGRGPDGLTPDFLTLSNNSAIVGFALMIDDLTPSPRAENLVRLRRSFVRSENFRCRIPLSYAYLSAN